MSRPLALFAGVGLALSLACGAAEEAEEVGNALQDLAKAMEQQATEGEADINPAEVMQNLEEAMKKLGEAGGHEPVDFRTLKELLPKKLRGFERGEATGEKATMSGIGTSTAHATYTNSDGGRIQINLVDAGGMSGVIRGAAFAWTVMDLEREWDDGFERTVQTQGYKGYEKYDNGDRNGEMNLFIEGRFVVGIEGRSVDFEDLERARDKVDLKELGKLKDHGAKAAEEPKSE